MLEIKLKEMEDVADSDCTNPNVKVIVVTKEEQEDNEVVEESEEQILMSDDDEPSLGHVEK